ncbi:restriction endonuclease subunit S [Nostoc sp. CMAA1605]|uniref:restriction endonuclease subunit S n=1 Tax=Nostoc sp. CMAA1605 TaxID=2055159 RepID=UPI001F492A92|nr:restriction endonuclease subunit S [Nostoc sp. CMAA1605]
MKNKTWKYRFTLLFLNSPSGMAEMRNLAITTSGLFSLSVGKIREILVPLPPLAEQKRIVEKCDRLMSLCDTLEAKLKQGRDSSDKPMEIAAKQVLTA